LTQRYALYPASSAPGPSSSSTDPVSTPSQSTTEDPSHVRVAVIDLGSSSFHLLIAEASLDGQMIPTIVPVVRHRSMLHLGKVVAEEGYIPRDVVNHAMQVVRRHRASAQQERVTAVIVLATAAIRDAANAVEIIKRLERAAGTNVRLLEGHEEARLIFIGQQAGLARLITDAAGISLEDSGYSSSNALLPLKQRSGERHAPHFPHSILTMDLGGGSLELAFGSGDTPHWASSVRIGVARLAGEFASSISPSDPLSLHDRRNIYRKVAKSLEPIKDYLRDSHPQLVSMSGGTARALGRLAEVIYKGSRDGYEYRVSNSNADSSNALLLRGRAGHLPNIIQRMPSGSMVQESVTDTGNYDARASISRIDLRGANNRYELDAGSGLGSSSSGLGLLHLHRVFSSYVVDINTVGKLASMLSSLDLPARLALAGVQARRAPLLPIGACIMHAVMEELSFDSLVISEWGLREGAIVDFLLQS